MARIWMVNEALAPREGRPRQPLALRTMVSCPGMLSAESSNHSFNHSFIHLIAPKAHFVTGSEQSPGMQTGIQPSPCP